MPALAPALRKTLETTVVKARELAERGARASLEELDVAGNSHIASMTAEQERQRRRLRAHGRQLGDQAGSSKGSQSSERLVREMVALVGMTKHGRLLEIARAIRAIDAQEDANGK
jgi:hypothetical protein